METYKKQHTIIYFTIPFVAHHKAKLTFNGGLRKFSDRKIVEMPTWNQDIIHYFDGRVFLIQYDDNGYLRNIPQRVPKEKAVRIIYSYREWFRRKSECYRSFRQPANNLA